jgi:hypothetical protein
VRNAEHALNCGPLWERARRAPVSLAGSFRPNQRSLGRQRLAHGDASAVERLTQDLLVPWRGNLVEHDL